MIYNQFKLFAMPLLLLAVMMLSIVGIHSISAESISNIYVNTQGNDNWDGLSAAYNNNTGSGPKKTIKNALETVPIGGTIYIANGIYNEYDLIINKNIKIIGENQQDSIINANKQGKSILTVASGYDVDISTVTIANIDNVYANGGAIDNKGKLTINNCRFSENKVQFGGAIYNCGTLSVNNSVFSKNLATIDGGAIDNVKGTLSLTNCIFDNNEAYGYGGAINSQEGILTINNSTLTKNSGDQGGAISNAGTATIIQSTITNNNARITGAIANMDWGNWYTKRSKMTISYCKINNNKGKYDCGGIENDSHGTLTITESSIRHNTACQGGGIYSQGKTKINNCSIVGNKAGIGSQMYCTMGSVDIK